MPALHTDIDHYMCCICGIELIHWRRDCLMTQTQWTSHNLSHYINIKQWLLHKGSFTIQLMWCKDNLTKYIQVVPSTLKLHWTFKVLRHGLCAFVLQLTVKIVMLWIEPNCWVLNVKYKDTAPTALGKTTSSPCRKLSNKGQQELKHVACLYTNFLPLFPLHVTKDKVKWVSKFWRWSHILKSI